MSICFNSRSRQRGDMMLEALMGVLITSVIGAGLAHVASRVLSSQRDAKMENLAVEQLRQKLHDEGVGLCDGREVTIDLPDGKRGKDQKSVGVDCGSHPPDIEVAVAVAGMSIKRDVKAPQHVALSVSASDLGVGSEDTPLVVSSRQ